MKITNGQILSLLLISFSLLYNSCTLIGLSVGAAADSRKSDYEIVNPNNYNTISILSEITVYKDDRTIAKGRFIELNEEYLTLETMFGLEKVNMENIINIQVKSKKNSAKWVGLGIGLAIDVGAYIAIKAFIGFGKDVIEDTY